MTTTPVRSRGACLVMSWLLAGCLILAALPVSAQTDAGGLRVLVLDATDAVIPGATVELRNVFTNTPRTGVSDQSGYSVFAPIPRGTYSILVSLAGFQSVEVKGVLVDVSERTLVRVKLAMATTSEVVHVTADAVSIQTEDSSLGQVIKGDVAVELPLAGRRYTELALLVPGVSNSTMTAATRGPGWFLVNGNYHTQNNFVLDGFDNNQGTQNAQALSAQVVQPSPDSISEFKVQTNAFSAEFGRSAGAVVNVSIKSGTNTPHGSAWYYNRDAGLAATSWRANLIGAPKDTLEWHQAGATFGGPLRKDRIFFFGAYEGFRRSFSETFLSTVPTAAMKTGAFPFAVMDPNTGQPFAGNVIPASRFDALGKKIIDLYPSPNLSGRLVNGRPADNYGAQRQATENTHKIDLRTDVDLSAQDRFFARYSFLQQDVWRDPIFEGLGDGVGNQGQQFNRNHSLGISWNRILGPRLVNEARFGYNNTHAAFVHATANDQTATEFGFLGLPAQLSTTGGLPLMDFNNYNDLGTRGFRPQYQDPISYQFLDTASLVMGNHSMRVGGEIRYKRSEIVDISRRNPSYNFTGGRFTGDEMGDLLLGSPFSMTAGTAPVIPWNQEVYAAFLQDDWKVAQNVTLNLGLRYEYGTPYYSTGDTGNVNFDFATGQLITATAQDKYLMGTDKNNFGPRVGFAWQVRPDHVVVRGGYGMFYSIEDMRGSEGMIAQNPPALIQSTLTRVGTGPPPLRLSDPFPSNMLDNYNPANVSVKARELDQNAATVHQWNAAVEFKLPWDSSAEVAYVGNLGRNLLAIESVNGVPFGQDGSVPANRPYPGWQQIDVITTRSQSDYNGLQLKYEKRFNRGWYMLGAYTFASAYDETGAWGAGGNGVQTNVKPDLSNVREALSAERGPNGQFPRHRFTLTEVWQLPIGRGHSIGANMSRAADAIVGGWQISSITTLRSGLPVNVSLAASGTNPATGLPYSFLNRNGGVLRPNLLGDPNANSDASADRLHYLDPLAYALQPINTPGNAPRNSARGPGFFTTDLSLVKRIALGGGASADIRIECFNLFNRTNFQDPNGSWGTTNFGVISDAYDPRVTQIAFRIAF